MVLDKLKASVTELERVHDKDDLIYRYPSQTQYNLVAEWASQFEDDFKFIAAQYEPSFKRNWHLNVKYQAYNLGKFSALYKSYIWIKANSILKLSETIIKILEDQSDLFVAINSSRPLLEQIGSLALSEKSFSSFFKTVNPGNKEEDWLFSLEDELRKWTHGTRINWEDYFEKGLRNGSRGSFDASKGHFGVEAGGLMQGIDLLAKKVKGARKAYEFASEFVHPNYGVFALSLGNCKVSKQSDGLVLWERTYSAHHSVAGQHSLDKLLTEYFEICAESIGAASKLISALKAFSSTVKVQSRKCVKKILKAQPDAFSGSDLCPCFSGKTHANCCKKKSKVKRHRQN